LVAEVPAAVPLTQVAAEGAHVADLRARDFAGRRGQGREVLAEVGVGGDGGEGDAGADGARVGADGDRLERRNRVEADDAARLGDVVFLHRHEGGAPEST